MKLAAIPALLVVLGFLGLCAYACLLGGCGTHLSSTDQQAEEATEQLAASIMRDDAGAAVSLKAHAAYCNSAAILARAHVDAAAPSGAPVCK